MTQSTNSTSRRPAVLWWGLSLALAAVFGLVLTWSVGVFDRLGALPAPQSPAWYDCVGAGERYALQYLQGSDRIGLQWSDGTTLQGESFPDRLVWHRSPAGLSAERAATLPHAIRYESAARIELVNAAQVLVQCNRR